jgi:acyl-CoA thioesterase
MSFDEDIALRSLGPGRYACEISRKHWVIAGPNGGYLAALLTRAGDEHLAEPRRQLRSFTVHYLRPPSAGSAEIEVTTEQLGRSVAYLRLKMTQNEKPILIATGAWAMPREGYEFAGWPMPETHPPEACSSVVTDRHAEPPPIRKQWETRSAVAKELGSGELPDLTWWIRPPIHRELDTAMIVAITDALPPPIFVTEVLPMSVPTVDLTVHIRAQLSAVAWQPGDWVLARFSTRYASGGFLEEDGALWSADGTLLAHSRQLALCALVPPDQQR